jgi:hypothetical protein
VLKLFSVVLDLARVCCAVVCRHHAPEVQFWRVSPMLLGSSTWHSVFVGYARGGHPGAAVRARTTLVCPCEHPCMMCMISLSWFLVPLWPGLAPFLCSVYQNLCSCLFDLSACCCTCSKEHEIRATSFLMCKCSQE